MSTIGMIGLGRTGLPIARNLLERRHEVVGYRRSDDSALASAGGRVATCPRDVATAAKIILAVLPSTAALEDVMHGERGLLAALGPGHVVVELSSYPLAVKEKYRDLVAACGATLIDGEISGTPAMTAGRASVFLLAGDQTACAAALRVCSDATEHAKYVGAFGSATKLKLIANLLVAVHTSAAAEAMLLVERAGVDPKLAIDVLGLGAGSSTMWKARAPSMAARKFVDPAPGPVAMLAAYLEPIRVLAEQVKSPTPLFSIASDVLHRALADGRAQEDIACVIDVYDTHPTKKGSTP